MRDMSSYQKKLKGKIARLQVVSSNILVVPFPIIHSFFSQEIAAEGSYRGDVPLMFLFPNSKRGEATPEAIQELFADLQKVRERQPPTIVDFAETGIYVDVGLIDIPVFFQGDESDIFYLMKTNGQVFFQENLKQLDLVLGEKCLKYMSTRSERIVTIMALQCYAPDRTFQLKYHNVIFNLTKNGSELSYLNVRLFLSELARDGRILSLVG
ncbi:hypothetical protein C7B80_23090 [Cyanosarcina cf. burmensis CCALA 770]|jgi:hypothetical protein|nr:hypothetical protein C7B80_23090 [Cyanosarcina cf. burmensis CCALA 770]